MENIYLNEDQFNALLEYSISMPTGTTAGKQWKRHVFVFYLKGKKYNAGYKPAGAEIDEDYWLMGEYGEVDLDHVPITWRRIVLKNKETEIPNTKNALGI